MGAHRDSHSASSERRCVSASLAAYESLYASPRKDGVFTSCWEVMLLASGFDWRAITLSEERE